MQQSLSVENKVKKARLIFVKKIQDSDDKQYETVEIEVAESVDLADYASIGGEWLQANNKGHGFGCVFFVLVIINIICYFYIEKS